MDPLVIQSSVGTYRTDKDGGLTYTFIAAEDMSHRVADLLKLKGEPLYVVIMTESQYRGLNGAK